MLVRSGLLPLLIKSSGAVVDLDLVNPQGLVAVIALMDVSVLTALLDPRMCTMPLLPIGLLNTLRLAGQRVCSPERCFAHPGVSPYP